MMTRQFINGAEQFFVLARSLFLHQDRLVVLRSHGISPTNRPLGYRDLHVRLSELTGPTWLVRFHELWPFGVERIIRGAFVIPAEWGPEDDECPVFHFIMSHANGHAGVPVLARQSVQVTGMRQQDEWWAVMLHSDEHERGWPTLQVTPFWYPVTANGQVRRFDLWMQDTVERMRPGEFNSYTSITRLRLRANSLITCGNGRDGTLRFQGREMSPIMSICCNYVFRKFLDWQVLKKFVTTSACATIFNLKSKKVDLTSLVALSNWKRWFKSYCSRLGKVWIMISLFSPNCTLQHNWQLNRPSWFQNRACLGFMCIRMDHVSLAEQHGPSLC